MISLSSYRGSMRSLSGPATPFLFPLELSFCAFILIISSTRLVSSCSNISPDHVGSTSAATYMRASLLIATGPCICPLLIFSALIPIMVSLQAFSNFKWYVMEPYKFPTVFYTASHLWFHLLFLPFTCWSFSPFLNVLSSEQTNEDE